MTSPTRWGILGTGSIAKKFAEGLTALPEARLVAVGSRTAEAAAAFGERYQVPHRHASYEALARDPEVEAIYISTPHTLHCENTLLCLGEGKAVLCEKPFAINSAQATQMVGAARDRGVLLMEAMWTRFLPVMGWVRQSLPQIGQVRLVSADFGFRAGYNRQSRLFAPELGGGALLDVGIYVLSFASMILGPRPAQLASATSLGESGVDEQSSLLLSYADGAQALLSCAVRTNTPQEARIIGTEGSILLDSPFWRGTAATLRTGGGQVRAELPLHGNGYNYEAAEIGRCLRAGETESLIIPLDETLAIMRLMDQARAQWGLRYPME
ncbi:MAG: Gfo/Idh/MocA family oxidoreductase [Candidatus Latescibacteria bacterium]|nr:Gfo/Idh/MocA family oxidoreductase [Candidatus Latescibacterota bacterium]